MRHILTMKQAANEILLRRPRRGGGSSYIDVRFGRVRVSDHEFKTPFSARAGDWPGYREPWLSLTRGPEIFVSDGVVIQASIPRFTRKAVRAVLARAARYQRAIDNAPFVPAPEPPAPTEAETARRAAKSLAWETLKRAERIYCATQTCLDRCGFIDRTAADSALAAARAILDRAKAERRTAELP